MRVCLARRPVESADEDDGLSPWGCVRLQPGTPRVRHLPGQPQRARMSRIAGHPHTPARRRDTRHTHTTGRPMRLRHGRGHDSGGEAKMPTAPLALCVVTGCSNLVPRGRCPEHEAEARCEADARRPSGYARGWTVEWAAFSRDYLRRHPLCECDDCAALPQWRRPAATDVDHTGGHSRTCAHAFDERNVQALSHACHSRKTAREDGSFGRGRVARCGTTRRR